MGRLPNLVRLGSKLVLEILPSIAATVIGGYLLAQIHFGRVPEPPEPAQGAATSASEQDAPTAREERAAMRDVLKARRENPEVPAVVQPSKIATAPVSEPAHLSTPTSVPASPPAKASLPVAMDSIGPTERAATPARTAVAVTPRVRPEAVAPIATASVSAPVPVSATPMTVAPTVAAPISVPAADTASVYVPAPPPGLPSAPTSTPSLAAPTQLSPVVVSAAEQAPVPPPQGPVGSVLSTLSSFVGHAANATGDTVNWVIDLPGKAISAGGRVIGVSNPPPPPSRPFS
jgi:hypothetical protein